MSFRTTFAPGQTFRSLAARTGAPETKDRQFDALASLDAQLAKIKRPA